MRVYIVILVISNIIIIGFQVCKCKEIIYNDESNNLLFKNGGGIEKTEEVARISNSYEYNQFRSSRTVWNNIKSSAINTWHYVKNVAKNTEVKIKVLIEKLKTHGKKIKYDFEERIKNLQSKINDLLKKALGTGKIVKLCLQKQKQVIEDIVKHIIKDVTLCISGNLSTVALLENNTSVELDDSEFKKNLENILHLCTKTGKLDETCLHNAKEHILDKINDKESQFLNLQFESRNIADDILDKIVTCSTEGLLAASNNITLEAIQVIECVKEHKTNSTH